MMNHRTKTILMGAGWYPGRRVDISCSTAELRKRGFFLNAAIEDFLQEFMGLTIAFPNPRDSNKQDNFSVQPKESMVGSGATWTRAYEKRIEDRLCPLGEAFRGNMTLFMSSSGKVYAGTDDLLYFIGDNGCEAIQALLECPIFREVK